MRIDEQMSEREERLRRLAVQLVAQLGNETPEDMATALRYAGDLVDGFIRPGEGDRPRLHSIRALPRSKEVGGSA